MRTFLKVVLVLPALLFAAMGFRWLVDPAGVAPEFGFVLADGIGRSSQSGDFASFFLTLSTCILLGLVSGTRLWFYPPAMLLLFAASGRVLSWVIHDAAFAGSMIGLEVVVGGLLLIAARMLPEKI